MAWHHCLLTSTLTLTLPLTLTYYLPQAIRELLGKRGRAAWARRIFDAVYRAWKDIYVKVIPDPEPNRNPAPISNPNIYVKVCSKSVKVCSKSSLPPCFLTHCLSTSRARRSAWRRATSCTCASASSARCVRCASRMHKGRIRNTLHHRSTSVPPSQPPP